MSADALIENPALGYRTRDVASERGKIERGLHLGVRMDLIGIVASPAITIVEAKPRRLVAAHASGDREQLRSHSRAPATP